MFACRMHCFRSLFNVLYGICCMHCPYLCKVQVYHGRPHQTPVDQKWCRSATCRVSHRDHPRRRSPVRRRTNTTCGRTGSARTWCSRHHPPTRFHRHQSGQRWVHSHAPQLHTTIRRKLLPIPNLQLHIDFTIHRLVGC